MAAKRSLEARCWQVGIIAVLALAALFGGVIPAHAWSWSQNPYSLTGSGSAFCGDTQSYPCVLWDQPNNTSINVDVYLVGNLANFNYGYNFMAPTQNGMSVWNDEPAWNPYLVPCYAQYCGSVQIEGDLLPCHVLGETNLTYGTPFFYNGNWHAYIEFALLQLNDVPNTMFNNVMDLSEGDCVSIPDHADGRATVTHELGHVLGIGHSFLTSALMYESEIGGCRCFVPQADDNAAIEGIYPGYIP